MSPIITLTTDFGLKDGYVAAMKGVILGINPDATIVDISHGVTPQNVREGAFVLGSAHRYYPQETIHVAVIDPGVGTSRRALLIQGSGYYFTAPDNGVLSHVLEDAFKEGSPSHHSRITGTSTPTSRKLPPGFKAVSLTTSRFWRSTVSATFHGRDIFAPVAAHLSRGVPLEEFGDAILSVLAFPQPSPNMSVDGVIKGEVIHVDRFGNLITDVRAAVLPDGDMEIELGGHTVRGINASYEEGRGLLAIIGSAEFLEISERNGSAAATTGAEVGTAVIIRRLT